MPASWADVVQPACCTSGGLWPALEAAVIRIIREHPDGM